MHRTAFASLPITVVLAACGHGSGGASSEMHSNAAPGGSASAPAESPQGAPNACRPWTNTAGATSQWVSVGADGHLAYKALPKGDRILDFSHAGYMGGGVAIPSIASIVPPAAQITVKPSGGEDTRLVQAAIDQVSAMPLVRGFRGAVLLAPGTFSIGGSLRIAASGVVLRGSGADPEHGTIMNVTGAPRTVIAMAGSGTWDTSAGPSSTITDDYVPSGATAFHVADASAFHVGQTVLVNRPVTEPWIHFMRMDTLVRNGKKETWLQAGKSIPSDRTIAAISGNTITLDVPLSDALDKSYVSPPGATISAYTFSGRIERVGLESMRIAMPVTSWSSPGGNGGPPDWFEVVSIFAVQNGWVRDIAATNVSNGIMVGNTSKWVTIESSAMSRARSDDPSGARPFHYSIAGQQILIQRCSSDGAHVFSYATQARTPGPNVVLHSNATGTPSDLQPHQRWATGLLVDNLGPRSGGAGVEFIDRGIDGTGHGWSIGYSVIWNGAGSKLQVQSPPGAADWAIGFDGRLEPAPDPGIIESLGKPVKPGSLYLAQLCERLGAGAVRDIGYSN